MKENLEKLLSAIQKEEDLPALNNIDDKTLHALKKMMDGKNPEDAVVDFIKERTL